MTSRRTTARLLEHGLFLGLAFFLTLLLQRSFILQSDRATRSTPRGRCGTA